MNVDNKEFLTMALLMMSKYKLNMNEICSVLIVPYMLKREYGERA